MKALWLLSKGRTVISLKLPTAAALMGDKDLELHLDMDNSSCNKGLKDIRI